MSVALSAFDTNGNLITGSGIQNPVTITLTAGQEYAKLVSELFGLQSFDGWIEADASATGLGIFVATGSSDMLHLDGTTVVDLSDDFILFHPGASAILVNPSSRVANLTLTALSTGTSQSLAIAPRSRLVTTLGDVTRVHSSEPLSSMERVAAARSLASTAAIPVSQAQPTLVFPNTFVGAGYSSVLTIANTGAAQQTVTIILGAFSTSVTINANAAISGSIANLLSVPQNALITGAVRISASSASLIGVLDVQTQTDSAIVPAQPGATSYTLLNVINGNGFYTGLAFATGNAGALVRIDLYSPAGNLVASGTTSLAANEQLSKLLNELVPAAASQLGGYVRIHSDQPIWAWELFGSPTALASAPPL
jgi:hypothetical protein